MTTICTRLTVAVLLLLGAVPLAAQTPAPSLGELAKKTAEERAKTKTPAKVYTNKDVEPSTRPLPDATPIATNVTPIAVAPPTPDTPAAVVAKDELYWHGRSLALHGQLDADVIARDAVARRYRSYASATNRTTTYRDGAYVSRDLQNKTRDAYDELTRVNAVVTADKLAIVTFEEEARRAGVPPGWLRIP